MGPRRRQRGRIARDHVHSRGTVRFNGATSSSSWKAGFDVDAGTPLTPASMGPRRRGRGARERRRAGRRGRFNGATSSSTWKGTSSGTSGAAAASFNGAGARHRPRAARRAKKKMVPADPSRSTGRPTPSPSPTSPTQPQRLTPATSKRSATETSATTTTNRAPVRCSRRARGRRLRPQSTAITSLDRVSVDSDDSEDAGAIGLVVTGPTVGRCQGTASVGEVVVVADPQQPWIVRHDLISLSSCAQGGDVWHRRGTRRTKISEE
jgi:hypothetical protein